VALPKQNIALDTAQRCRAAVRYSGTGAGWPWDGTRRTITEWLVFDLLIRQVADRSGYSLLSYPTTNPLPGIVELPAMAQAILPSCYVGGLGRAVRTMQPDRPIASMPSMMAT